MTGHMPGAAGGPIALPDIARVNCHVCGQARLRKRCERVWLAPRRYAWRCRDCSR